MKELISVTVPKMFEGVQTFGARYSTSNFHNHEQKHVVHLDCDTSFWLDERIQYNFYREIESIPICPHCGKPVVIGGTTENDDSVPIDARLKVFECKNTVVLRIRYRILTMHEWGTEKPHEYGTRVETIRFHVNTGVSSLTILTSSGKKHYGIANPFRLDFFNDSYLRFFNRENLSKFFRRDLVNVLSVIRKTISRKFKQTHGFLLRNIYVSKSEESGYLYYPLLNIAFRLSCPDAKNLPPFFADVMYPSIRRNLAEKIGIDGYGLACLDSFFSRNAYVTGNIVSDLLQSFDLMDTPFNRRELSKDMFVVGRLKQIQDLTMNPDFQHFLFQRVHRLDMYHSFRTLLDLGFTEQKLMNLVRTCYTESGDEIPDSMRSLNNVLSNAKIMWENGSHMRLDKAPSNPMKLATFTNGEAFRLKYPNRPLPVPEKVRVQLASQIGDSRFYLPKDTWQLKNAADIFHNCVFGYADRLEHGSCYIVFMADKNGALVACLEVRAGELVQAKLRFNKPAKEDADVSAAIFEWCMKVGLAIKTLDVPLEIPTSKSA